MLFAMTLAFGAGYGFRALAGDTRAEGPTPLGILASTKGGVALPSYKPDLSRYETIHEVVQIVRQHFVRPDVNETELTYGAVRGMLGSLGDPFTRFMTPEEYDEFQVKNNGEFEGIGATLSLDRNEQTGEERLIVAHPVAGGPADKAGMRSGDEILAIDGRSTKGMSLPAAVQLIRGKRGQAVTLTVKRAGKEAPFDLRIVREIVEIPSVTSRMLEEKIGYVQLGEFNEKTDQKLDEAFANLKKEGMRGLIFDLRGDPGGLLDVAVSVGSRFIKDGPIAYTRGRNGGEDMLSADPDRYLALKVPLVVLVNEGSASASEIVAGAIQDRRVGTVVGTRTYGKASVQLLMKLKNGGAVAVTTAKYFTPSKRDITKKGIDPDVVVARPGDAGRAGGQQDPQLDKAVEIVKKKIAAAARGEPAGEAKAPTKANPG